MIYQNTIKDLIVLEGVGLHTGKICNIRLVPAPVNTGIKFFKDDKGEVPLSSFYVSNTKLSTVISQNKNKCTNCIATIEHLLATLHGMHIDNLIIEILGDEIPIFDGSAKIFYEAIDKIGLYPYYNLEQNYNIIDKDIYIKKGDSYIFVTPFDGLILDVTIKFEHPLISKQHFIYDVFKDSFEKELVNARTFATLDQIEQAKKAGLIKGGNLDCAIVLTKDSILNGPLNYKDEFVRHKVLDLLGDLYIDGPIKGYVEACCNGHYLNNKLMQTIQRIN